MTSSYTKSLSGDFGGNLNQAQLHQEIESSAIVPNILSVELKGDVVTIIFDSALSGAEQTTLDGLVSTHVPSHVKYNEYYPLFDKTFEPFIEFGDSLTPHTLSFFQYPGFINSGDYLQGGYILHNGIYSTGATGGNFYEINFVVRDMTNCLDLINVSLTGNPGSDKYYYVPQAFELPTVQNIPSGPATLQVSYDLVNGTYGRLYSVQIL